MAIVVAGAAAAVADAAPQATVMGLCALAVALSAFPLSARGSTCTGVAVFSIFAGIAAMQSAPYERSRPAPLP